MELISIYQNGGTNQMLESVVVVVKGVNLPGVVIQGRTDTRDGCKTQLLYNGESMQLRRYNSFLVNPGYQGNMASDLSDDINSVMEMMGLPRVSIKQELIVIAEMIRQKCASRYGHEIPNSDYEIRIEFQ